MKVRKNTMKGVWVSLDILQLSDVLLQHKFFLAEIDNLDNGVGCYADNAHFANLFGLKKNSCSAIINNLWERGFLEREMIEDVEFGAQRILKLKYPFTKNKTLLTPIVATATTPVATATDAVATATTIIGTEYNTEYIEEVSVNNQSLNLDGLIDKIKNASMCIEAAARQCKLSVQDIKKLIPHFAVHILGTEQSYNNNTDFLSHFQSWCRKQPKGVADVSVELGWFINLFNKLSGKDFKATTKVKQLFIVQMQEGFSGAEMDKAIRNLYSSKNTWHKKQSYIEATPEFLLTGDRLNKFLNARF